MQAAVDYKKSLFLWSSVCPLVMIGQRTFNGGVLWRGARKSVFQILFPKVELTNKQNSSLLIVKYGISRWCTWVNTMISNEQNFTNHVRCTFALRHPPAGLVRDVKVKKVNWNDWITLLRRILYGFGKQWRCYHNVRMINLAISPLNSTQTCYSHRGST